MANLILENEIQEIPEETGLLVMDFVNTLVDCTGSYGIAFKPRPGVRKFLDHYRRKVPIVVSSDANKQHMIGVLKKLGLNSFLKAIYGTEHMINDYSKDISRICREQGVAPERTVMIGDMPAIDGESARKAGARYIQVPMPGIDDKFSFTKYLGRRRWN